MRNLFIRWYRRNREATIDDINLPDDLHAGWELTGQFDKNLNPLTDEGYLIFTPDYEANEETLVALVYYKNKYYMSNQLTLINRVDAKNDQIEDIKKDLIDQAEKDRELIDANKRAVNALIIESGYYAENEDGTTVFNNNNGLYFYYTRSGLIRESEKLRTYGLRCYSSDKDTIIKNLTWEFPQKNTMVKINGGATAEDGYYKQLITIDRKYNPGKTNNIVTVTATCDITVRDENDNIKDVYENVTIENQIELLFGYYSCEGTEHSLTAYWTNSAGEVVNCLVPGKTYEAHLLLDGKEVTSPTWYDVSGNSELAAAYTPTVGDIHLRKGIVSIEDNMSLGCWLGAKISYNEDNIIEGMIQLVYQTDGTLHMRDNMTDADVSPQYRLELLLEDERTHNQEYADGIWWDPYSGNQLSVSEIEARVNASIDPEIKKELIAGWSYDSDGKPNAYFSGPSNWSIVQFNINSYNDRQEFFMRTKEDLSNYETWSNKNSVSCDYFSLVYVPQSQDTPLVRSVVELIPKADYLTNAENYIFGINIYTYTGQLLATVPLRISRNQYASIYIDKMANSTGIVIDSETNTIFSPRILAGKYETTKNVGNTGNKVFTGVALGDFADPETEASMQLAGVYGFRQGQQAYAFKEDGTGFIGLDGKSKIKFNQTGNIPLAIGDDVFTVDTDGDVNLTGSVTGGNENSGYHLDKNGSGYIVSNEGYGIYFDPGFYPIYISNPTFKNYPSSAPFSVDKQGNVNLQGSNVNIDTGNVNITGIGGVNISQGDKYININSEGITLNGNIKFSGGAADSINSAVSGPDLSNYVTKSNFGQELASKISNKRGLYYENGELIISTDYLNALEISADNITAGTLTASNSNNDLLNLDGTLQVLGSLWIGGNISFGHLGAGYGKDGSNHETYGVTISGGSIDVSSMASQELKGEGGYCFVSCAGARLGYRDSNGHVALFINSSSIQVQHFYSNGSKVDDGKTLWSTTNQG